MAKMCGTALHAFVAAFIMGFFSLGGIRADRQPRQNPMGTWIATGALAE